MRGQPGNNARPHVRSPPSFLGMDAWMTSQLNVALIRKIRGSLMCLDYFLTLSNNQALADVRSEFNDNCYLRPSESVIFGKYWREIVLSEPPPPHRYFVNLMLTSLIY